MSAVSRVGYTAGTLYKRHQSVGYSPGSHYKRFGSHGLYQPRNMQQMNRQAAESANSAVVNSGPQMFDASAAESQGRSELAAKQVLARVQQMAMAIANAGESVSSATTGSTVDTDA